MQYLVDIYLKAFICRQNYMGLFVYFLLMQINHNQNKHKNKIKTYTHIAKLMQYFRNSTFQNASLTFLSVWQCIVVFCSFQRLNGAKKGQKARSCFRTFISVN